MKEIFEYLSQCRISSKYNLMGHRILSYICPSVWNKLPSSMKKNVSLDTFKHDVKKHYLEELRM